MVCSPSCGRPPWGGRGSGRPPARAAALFLTVGYTFSGRSPKPKRGSEPLTANHTWRRGGRQRTAWGHTGVCARATPPQPLAGAEAGGCCGRAPKAGHGGARSGDSSQEPPHLALLCVEEDRDHRAVTPFAVAADLAVGVLVAHSAEMGGGRVCAGAGRRRAGVGRGS
jgi:hypothetical protein